MFLILFFLVCVDNKDIFDRKTQNTSPCKFPHCCYNIFFFSMNTENPLDIWHYNLDIWLNIWLCWHASITNVTYVTKTRQIFHLCHQNSFLLGSHFLRLSLVNHQGPGKDEMHDKGSKLTLICFWVESCEQNFMNILFSKQDSIQYNKTIKSLLYVWIYTGTWK